MMCARCARSEGALSTRAWLRNECHLTPQAASGRVLVARRIRDDERLASVMRGGRLSHEHAAVITSALDKLPAAAADEAGPILLNIARHSDPAELRRSAETIREAVTPELLLEEAGQRRDRRFFDVAETFEGMVSINGMLDPEGGALILAAVNALATPDGPDDTRTATQRRADAMVECIAVALREGELPETGGQRPHVSMTVDVGRMSETGHVFARTDTGAQLVAEAVRRILCDSSVSRIVMAGRSELLDVGRTTRTIPAAILRALWARDGGCVFPGCDRPAKWTDAHHIWHWSLGGGPTSLDNLVLLCRRHHMFVHEEGWQIERHDTHWIFVPPGDTSGIPPPGSWAA
ncbi:MAG: hypothetical protein JWM93_1008 [Frankiales bacterium]|nr:hypothetical protein [Frankiales bacterium]